MKFNIEMTRKVLAAWKRLKQDSSVFLTLDE
jgi:hypothetical protein